MRIVLVIPTYNERGNIGRLIDALQAVFESLRHDMHILVVDDNSPDGTAEVVRRHQRRYSNLHLLQGEKSGLGAAYIRGMRHALDALRADALFEMDADFSHNPSDVPRLVTALEQGADFVIGSRYVRGGSIPREWGLHRRLNSRFGNIVARHLAGISRVRDCTAGFRAIRANVIRQIDLQGFGVQGYAFQITLLHAAVVGGARVVELPVNFVDRTEGESKLGIKDIVEFFRSAAWIRFQSSKVFVKFCIIGASGVLVNLGVFTALLALGVSKFVASPIAIQCSIFTNFLGNNYWTFRWRNLVGGFHGRGLRFNAVSILSLGISYSTFLALSHAFPAVAPQVHQLIGIVPAILVNYFLNSYWTFRHDSLAQRPPVAGTRTAAEHASKPASDSRHKRGLAIGTVALIALATVALIVFGLFGVGRGGSPNFDGQVLYAAGRTWLSGGNPYDFQQLLRSNAGTGVQLRGLGFFYPPQSGALCMTLALLPYAAAKYLWLAINLSALPVLSCLTAAMMRSPPDSVGGNDAWGATVMTAVIVGNPFTSQVVWWGQTSLLAFVAAFGAWYFYTRNRRVLAGICLGVATLKPQLCVLVIVWMLLEREFRTVLVGAATALALAAPPMLVRGPVNTFLEWRAALVGSYAMPPNLPSWPHMVGLPGLLDAARIPVLIPNAVWIFVGAALVFVLWLYRSRFNNLERAALVMVVTLVFNSYLHDYDYVAVIPVLAALWTASRPCLSRSITALVLTALLFAPVPLAQRLGSPIIVQWRTVVLLVMAMMIVRPSRREEMGSRSSRETPSHRGAAV